MDTNLTSAVRNIDLPAKQDLALPKDDWSSLVSDFLNYPHKRLFKYATKVIIGTVCF